MVFIKLNLSVLGANQHNLNLLGGEVIPPSEALYVGSTIKAPAARKIEVIVPQLGEMEPTSEASKLILNMLNAVAEMERNLLVE